MENKRLNVIELPSKNPWRNLWFESFFLQEMQKNPQEYYLIFYQNFSSIILGKTLVEEKEIFTRKKHPPVLRRLSGGGSVVHGNGNLNYAFAANLQENANLFSIPFSYQKILGGIINELNSTSFLSHNGTKKFHLQGHSDICVEQKNILRKISGNSQVRKKQWLLHHGTFLFDKQLISPIVYFLKFPEKIPDYRGKRPHKDFLVRSLPFHSASQIKNILIRSFEKNFFAQAHRTTVHIPVRSGDVKN